MESKLGAKSKESHDRVIGVCLDPTTNAASVPANLQPAKSGRPILESGFETNSEEKTVLFMKVVTAANIQLIDNVRPI